MATSLRRFASTRLKGWATLAGTTKFSQRIQTTHPAHFRKTYTDGPLISSMGIGTYIGAPDDETDELVRSGIVESVQKASVNHIDTAINYRYQKAERTVGRALQSLFSLGFTREEFLISSKIGYIPEDADRGIPGRTIVNRLIEEKKMSEEDVVAGVHCMHEAFLSDQLDRSRDNLGLDTLDILYLHNCVEGQMPVIGKDVFLTRLAKAFEFCEEAVRKNAVRSFGLATWLCFRSPPDETHLHLSLPEVLQLAEKVGGMQHNFRFVQVPINIVMAEAFVMPWQQYKAGKEIFLNVATDLGVNVIVSSPLFQGKLASLKLPSPLPVISDQGAMHVQLMRSLPSACVKSVLVGMKSQKHIQANAQIPTTSPLPPSLFWDSLKPPGQQHAKIAITLR